MRNKKKQSFFSQKPSENSSDQKTIKPVLPLIKLNLAPRNNEDLMKIYNWI